VTHRDVARRISSFYLHLSFYESHGCKAVAAPDDLDYFLDRLSCVGADAARVDTIVRILMAAYGERDADGIMRPEIK
jgi:hypothetical protein